MQPVPGPIGYKLLKDGVVAALQILYLEVVSLAALVGKSEANKRLSTEIGESCCSKSHLTHCCQREFGLQQRYLANLVFCTSAQFHCHLLVCLPPHVITHLCILSSQVQVHPRLTVLSNVSRDARSQVQNM